MMWMRTLCFSLVCLLMVGCASFPAEKTASVKPVNVSGYQNKPSVFVSTKFFTGDPKSANPAENAYAANHVRPIIEKAFKNTGYFSRVSTDIVDQDKSDYTMEVTVHNYGNGGLGFLSGFISGLTLGIIPGAATDNYQVSIKLIDRSSDAPVATVSNDDAITTWIGIWLLPFAGNTPTEALETTLNNQVKAAVTHLVEGKKLRYSLLKWNVDA